MIDHLVGRPNPSWKRAQVFFVIFFWLWRITCGDSHGPRVLWIRRLNRKLHRFTPWQIVVSTLTAVYAVRNIDKILGLGAPEPLARLYSSSYYRATWVSTGLDAGFATAMNLRPKWLRDICSVLFSVYYIIYANEADEKLRRFRAVPTVEMLRATWEKTTNPYIRLFTEHPSIAIYRKILLPRPKTSPYTRPITAHLFFSPNGKYSANQKDASAALLLQEDLVLDLPGGGYVAMTPEHHDERLRIWASNMGRPVLSLEYGKAPEYPYPFAIDEAFDAYRVLVESKGKAIGMSGKRLNIIMTGDSAGATMATGVIIKILEHKHAIENPSSSYPLPSSAPPQPLNLPVALVLSYAALDFNFTSWMTPSNLRVLREETEADENRPRARSPVVLARRSSSFFYRSDEEEGAPEGWASGLRGAKDHLSHVSPLAVVGDERKRLPLRRKKSWGETLKLGLSSVTTSPAVVPKRLKPRRSLPGMRKPKLPELDTQRAKTMTDQANDGDSEDADGENDEAGYFDRLPEEDRPIEARVRWYYSSSHSPATSPLSGSQNASRNVLSAEKPVSLVTNPLHIDEQEKLKAEVVQADNEVADKRKREGVERNNAPIGTRLTMTSRTGYFQDRIVSPSMMRAMAILYIGPHLNPDFASDYHISPILTPSQLLAQFPPLLMQCGEKDPFVDDTIIFAGRVREAKRQRKEELRKLLDERSSNSIGVDSPEFFRLQAELEGLEGESEEDWVQMQLFSDWSHGYLQMPTLMREARAVIIDLAAWMDDAFDALRTGTSSRSTSNPTTASTVSENSSGSSFLSHLWHWRRGQPATPQPNVSVHDPASDSQTPQVNPRVRILTPEKTDSARHEHPNPLTSETETDADEVITIVPRAQRRPRDGKGSFGSDETVQTRLPSVRKLSEEDHTRVSGRGSDADGGHQGGRADYQSKRDELLRATRALERVVEDAVQPAGAVRPAERRRDSGRAKSSSRTRGSRARSRDREVPGADRDDPVRGERESRPLTRSPKDVDTAARSGTPTKNPLGTATSQTISEAELMRRRRLLDSHIFVSDKN